MAREDLIILVMKTYDIIRCCRMRRLRLEFCYIEIITFVRYYDNLMNKYTFQLNNFLLFRVIEQYINRIVN
jgi:hypothetical protein